MLEIVAVSLASFYLTIFIRKLIDTDKRPIACDICMAFWTSLATLAAGVYAFYGDYLNLTKIGSYKSFLFVLPSAGLTYILLKIYEAIAPKELPNLSNLYDKDEKSTIVTK